MWDQGGHLFERVARVMTDPHIWSTAQLPAKRAVTLGASGLRSGVGAGGYAILSSTNSIKPKPRQQSPRRRRLHVIHKRLRPRATALECHHTLAQRGVQVGG